MEGILEPDYVTEHRPESPLDQASPEDHSNPHLFSELKARSTPKVMPLASTVTTSIPTSNQPGDLAGIVPLTSLKPGALTLEQPPLFSSFQQFSNTNVRRNVYNRHYQTSSTDAITKLLMLPQHLEKHLFIGSMACFDSFQLSFYRGIKSILVFPIVLSLFICQLTFGWHTSLRLYFQRKIQQLLHLSTLSPSDILRGTALGISIYVLLFHYTVASIYHYIRVQSTMKLYVVFNLTQLFERLITTIGEDITESAYGLIDSAAEMPEDEKTTFEDKIVLYFKIVYSSILTCMYLLAHTGLSIMQIMTQNVAINSNEMAMFVILQSNNFLEVKSFAFKKYFHATMFQITATDVVERFQLFITLIIIGLYNISHIGIIGSTEWLVHLAQVGFHLLFYEVGVDAIKHILVVKFNKLPLLYHSFSSLICRDLLLSVSVKSSNHPVAVPVTKRLGFGPDPLVVILFTSTITCLHTSNSSVILKAIMLLLCIGFQKTLLIVVNTICVLYAASHLQRYHLTTLDKEIPTDGGYYGVEAKNQPSQPKDKAPVIPLEKVVRYNLYGNKLPM